MKERPILFSGAMVRAILDGRKTQTRRVMKWQPDDDGVVDVGEIGDSRGVAYVGNRTSGGIRNRVPCPYGQPGDRLWVREAWRLTGAFANEKPSNYKFPDILKDNVAYRADPYSEGVDDAWRPSIYMPRGLSRILLEITNVRVERVQEISYTDSFAEGIQQVVNEGLRDDGSVRGSFRALWNSINAARGYGWEVNPWVWVVEFRRIK